MTDARPTRHHNVWAHPSIDLTRDSTSHTNYQVVNDYERLYDKATELRDALLGKGQLDPEKHFDVLDHVLDQLHDEQVYTYMCVYYISVCLGVARCHIHDI